MKRILLLLFISCGMLAHAQVYNNEWIDYTKTYYKFKVPTTGVYRITQASLATLGIANTPAQNFQLWRNGTQVPLYTTIATGTFGGGDYIEFWGEMNDGKPDNPLYRLSDYQLNDKWSLETDTSIYFLTINPSGGNSRLTTTPNNVAGNSLAAEPYFMYTTGKYYRDRLNPGYARNVGEYLYSSSYDIGEGFSSGEISAGSSTTYAFENLFAYTSAGQPRLMVNISGNADNPRTAMIKLNTIAVASPQVDLFDYQKVDSAVSLSSLSSNTAVVEIANLGTNPFIAADRMVVHKIELLYPRQFNFGGERNFEFNLPASPAGNYLQISGFSYGTTAPVLYDITNGKRYVADISAAPLVKIVLQGSSVPRRLVLVSQDVSNIATVSSFTTRNFVNYTAPASQGDYLIISNPVLYSSSSSVEAYRAYRSSAAGGSYNAKIYDVNQLIDQFGFGIKMTPLALRNFIFYAKTHYTNGIKFVFLLGKGVSYNQSRANESNPDLDKLNLVPTFGQPASDNLLVSNPGSSQPVIPIGRLSVINGAEVDVYLKKIKEYEAAQATSSPLIADKAWMKNVVHIVGADDGSLQDILADYMHKYTLMISDTLFGANVTTFSKTSTDAVQQLTNTLLEQLFEDGITLITYFGHSSSSTLEFNLNSPENYNNQGKYPMFIALGCNAGNFYNFNTARFQTKETLSEKYVLAPDRGTIGFIASTHFGIVHYLDIYNTRIYNAMDITNYGKSMGEIINEGIKQVFNLTTEDDYYARVHSEETALHGDPAITLNPHAKPDYVIEDPMVKIAPAFISIAEASFKLNAKLLNIGKAVNTNIVVEVKRKYPSGITEIIYRDTIPGIRFSDSISISIPIIPTRDKGSNRITVTVDADNNVDELYETNNSITKDVFIYEDEARPVYPYTYAIVNKQNIKLIASTANPFSTLKTYRMEMDTTEAFNSTFKVTRNLTSTGGILEFDPGITFVDSTVYYWRVATVPATGPLTWSPSSFVYLANSDVGFNQSHYFQHANSSETKLTLDPSTRQWRYDSVINNIFIKAATYPTATVQDGDNTVAVNDVAYIGPGCRYNEVIVNVFDPVTLKAWRNDYSSGAGLYNSLLSNCGSRRGYNFEYSLGSAGERKNLMDFLNIIPTGAYVTMRTNIDPAFGGNTYSSAWRADTSLYGSGVSLYHRLLAQGFTDIDTFNSPRTWAFAFRKNDAVGFKPQSVFSEGVYDKIVLSVDVKSSDTLGYIMSPLFGPAKGWKQLKWRGTSLDGADGDRPSINVIGVSPDGNEDTLYYNLGFNNQDFDISAINAAQYPFIKLRMSNMDSVFHTPYQLRYWRLTYVPAPEGAVVPSTTFQFKDTVQVGEPVDFKIAFKNISEANFDSLKVKLVVIDNNNVQHIVPISRQRKLVVNDTIQVTQQIQTSGLAGNNTLFIQFNPDDDQPEQYLFNNFAYRNLFVIGDTLNPLLDVTFDGVHILNRDIVSSKPHILVKLKDEAKWMILNDTSLLNVQVRFPDGTTHPFHFNTDTLKFTAAGQAPNTDNTATIDFNPYFLQDGDYELIVTGKDRSNNAAGSIEYRVAFQVINKAMISNMLNYPNPFTSSTAFVFTITGSEVPQNIKIQIMTITGKTVREITKDELGPLRVGRNITDFKWDGTDQYGSKLANGIYLYRVVTNLNGKALEKYKSSDDKTDQFFNNGYGKMYLMR